MENQFNAVRFKEIVAGKAREAKLNIDKFLAIKTSISKKTYYNVVIEKCTVSTLLRVLDELEIPVEEVFSNKNTQIYQDLESLKNDVRLYKNSTALKNQEIAGLRQDLKLANETIAFLMEKQRAVKEESKLITITLQSKVRT